MPDETRLPTPDLDPELWAGIAAMSDAIAQGALVTFPTDTVVALATSHTNAAALNRIYAVKRREPAKPIPILISEVAALASLAENISSKVRALAEAFWPGGLTMILPAAPGLPEAIAPVSSEGKVSVAVRIPDHPLALAIIAASGGAVAATSANISGEPPAGTAAVARVWLGPEVVASLDRPFPASNTSSTIVDLTHDTPTIIRAGAITAEMIASVTRALSEDPKATG